MNRSNVGNIVTNGMQILSVSAASAKGILGRNETTLNNLSRKERLDYQSMQADKMREEMQSYYNMSSKERLDYKNMQADKMRDEVETYYNKGSSPMQHLSQDEITKYREKQADNIRKMISEGEEVESVDDIMSNTISGIKENSPQIEEIKLKLQRDNEWYNSYIKGKNRLSNQLKHQIKLKLKGEDTDANV